MDESDAVVWFAAGVGGLFALLLALDWRVRIYRALNALVAIRDEAGRQTEELRAVRNAVDRLVAHALPEEQSGPPKRVDPPAREPW